MKRNIIIADKNPIFRSGLVRLLNSTGKASIVGEVSSTPELMDLVGKTRADLVFIDYSLTSENGQETIRTIREQAPGAGIFAMSELDNGPYVQQVKNLGINGFLSKNFNNNELLNRILSGRLKRYFVTE